MKLPVLTALTAAALLLDPQASARQTPTDTAPALPPMSDSLLDSPGIYEDGRIAQQTPSPPATSPQPVSPPPADAAPGATQAPAADSPATSGAPADENAEDFSMGDIPVVETVELTADQAKRALDAYVLVSEKYKDAALENYENLQDFVDQAPQGKAFEADIKAAGFATVNEWNTAITTLSFALANLSDDQTADIRQQIEELKADTEMAQDMRERMIAALNAMIPSDNNKAVIAELMKDPAYAEKMKLLVTEEAE